ncbi:ATP-dependent nuclease [Pseudomonas brassicacearum]|uniref:ATP-dependent nuclease n=2 Tax=Pseudomonas TaxID=286 RepID=UPI0009B7FCEF|nr:AAA family ATPase [Pseudomonas brassicacearum]
MQAKLNIIELRNFKRFSNISIKLRDTGLTLISGTNNSGKTSILHALAIWEFTKMLLVNYRGSKSLAHDYDSKNGLGIAPEAFSPISIPSLRYLWKDQNTNGSYGLKIKIGWRESGQSYHLELAYSLNGNNFAIKKSDSNLLADTKIPVIAYLPPFGGMNENETWLSIADRRKLIGKGQAGSVIRNLLLDLYTAHEQKIKQAKEELLAGRVRLPAVDKQKLELVDTEWRQLEEILTDVFRVKLCPKPFDSNFHNFVHVDVIDVAVNTTTGAKEARPSSRRDLMIEGSGFLQWVSVFALALDSNNDILLLDEPDAHLHTSLQSLLLEKLEGICLRKKKQILMVSHSPELIKLVDYEKMLHVEQSKASYLRNKEQKVLVLEGLGSKYFPLLDDIIRYKKVLLVENASDARALQSICKQLDMKWPENLVLWVTNKKHSERKTLIIELNQKIMQDTRQPINAYSLRDLDDENYSTTNADLQWNTDQRDDSGKHTILRYRTLRRREIENYLIIPTAISRYISKNRKNNEISTDVDAVNEYLLKKHGLVVPSNYKESDRESNSEGLFSKDGKQVLDGIRRYFKVKFNKEDYIQQIEKGEVCADLITIIKELIDMCKTK